MEKQEERGREEIEYEERQERERRKRKREREFCADREEEWGDVWTAFYFKIGKDRDISETGMTVLKTENM